MAITLDATQGGANSNTYLTLAEAETYFEGRLHVEVWDSSTEDNKNRSLVMASKRISQEAFFGDRQNDTQKLSFPRVGLSYLDGVYLDGIIPEQIKEAQCELALHLLQTDMSKPSVDTSNIKSVKVGSIGVDYAIDNNDNVSRGYDELPPFVTSLLSDFSRTVSSGGFFTVTR